jgi:hypothetical protein
VVAKVSTAVALVSPQGRAVLVVVATLTPWILGQAVITDVQGTACPFDIVHIPYLHVPSAVITLAIVV